MSVAGDSNGGVSENDLRRRFEGQLNKFTNVVKGWQYRWFVLDPESGRLEYYLIEERSGRNRGNQHLAGAVVIPSEEDSQTFTINFASGEIYKVRAIHAKERQVWVDRIRACALLHNEALASNHPPLPIREHLPPTPPGSRSHIASGEPSDQLQNLSLSALDAFGSVHDILHKVDQKHQELAKTIESLPACHDQELLILKATSQSTLLCMENALSLLQEYREHQIATPVVITKHVPKHKALNQGSASLIPVSPHRTLRTPSTPSPMLRIPPPTQATISTWHTSHSTAPNIVSPGFQDSANKKPEHSNNISAELNPNKIEVQSSTKAITVDQQQPTENHQAILSLDHQAVQSTSRSPQHGSHLSSPQRNHPPQPHGSPVINKPNQLFLDPSTARHNPNKSPSHNKSPRSSSPGIMRKFQAVKSGLKMVHNNVK